MKNKNSMKNPSDEILRSLDNIRGVCFSGRCDGKEKYRYLENMYIDHDAGGGAVESVPGYRKIYSFPGAIHSIARQSSSSGEEYMIIHAGSSLYRFASEERDSLGTLTPLASLCDADSLSISLGEAVYILDGESLVKIDKTGEVTVLSTDTDICGCKVGAGLGERVLFSANPSCPDKVISLSFSDSGEIKRECLAEGGEGYAVKSIITHGGELFVIKNADTYSQILYYSENEVGEYTLKRRVGICGRVTSALHLSDRLFLLTSEGVLCLSVSTEAIDIQLISEDVNPRLLREDLTRANIGLWRAYIVISVNGNFYISDTLDEYRWYYLKDIGTYKNDRRAYRYSSQPKDGYALHEDTDALSSGTVMSFSDGEGGMIYYVEDGKKKYLVYPTEEFIGGELQRADRLFCAEGLMWFSTCGNDICLFNTDKRGVAPESVRRKDGFDPENYAENYGDIIHPDYYSFDRHAPKYVLVTAPDDCGYADVYKDTVSASLRVSCKPFIKSKFSLAVRTDDEIAFNTSLHLSSNYTPIRECTLVSFPRGEYVRLRFGERSKKWMRKSFFITSDEFASPIGISSVSYRYRLRKRARRS